MKIVHVDLTGAYDTGWGYQENLISKYHLKAGNDVVMITNPFITDKETGKAILTDKKVEYDNGVKVIRLQNKLPSKINEILRVYKDFYKTLKQEKPDFIFVHGAQFLDAKVLCKYLKNHKDVICCVDNHADFSNSGRSIPALLLHKIVWKKEAQRLNKYVDVFFGVMPSRCDFLKNVYGIPEEKIELLVMGTDDDKLPDRNSLNDLKRMLDIKENDFVIVTGGKIDEFKTETFVLMDAINELNNQNIKLLIFGSIVDSLKEEFNNKLQNSKYLGWIGQEDIYKYLSIGDLAIYPGRHSVLWEQTVCLGTPIVVKEWDLTKHVDIGGNCIFVKGDNKEEFKNIINNLYTDKETYNKMLLSAKKDERKQFLYSEIAKKSIEVTIKKRNENK